MTDQRIEQLYDIDAEWRFLAAVCDDKDYFIDLEDDFFTSNIRKSINLSVYEIYQDTDAPYIDRAVLYDHVQHATKYPPSEITDALREMGGAVGYQAPLYAQRLREARRKRLLMRLTQKLTDAIFSGDSDQIDRLKASIAEVERRTASTDVTLISTDYLLTTEFPEPVWVIKDLLPAGMSMLAGRPKAGKSWLALQIADAVSHGDNIFSRQVKRRKVLYVALEDSPRRLAGRMKLQKWTETTYCKFMLSSQFASIGGLEKLPALTQDYSLIIVDTFTRAQDDDQYSPQDMKTLLDPLQVSALKNDCALLFVDHMPKRSGRENEYSVIDDVFGSVAKTGVSDVIWGLYRDNEGATGVLAGTGRDIMDFRIPVAFEQGLWSECGLSDRAQWAEYRHAVLECIEEAGDISQSDIVAETGLNKGSVSKECDYLAAYSLARSYRDGRRIMWQSTVAGREVLDIWNASRSAGEQILQGNTLKGSQKPLLDEPETHRTDVQGGA